MILFFDTETTGIPKNYNAPISDVENYPRLVQLGYVLVDNGNILHSDEWIIKPDGFDIPVEASNVHGVTTEKAIKEGSPINSALVEFKFWLDNCDTIAGHNVHFDEMVVGAEWWRLYQTDPFEGKKRICTMMSSIEFCGLPGKYPGKLKYPKLAELYFALFNKEMGHAHTALADIENTVACYNALVERGIIKDE